jgi:hypothetical protein
MGGVEVDARGQLHCPAALPPGKEPSVTFDRRLGGPQNWSRWRGEEEYLAPTRTRNLNHRPSSPVACRYTDWAIAAAIELREHLQTLCTIILSDNSERSSNVEARHEARGAIVTEPRYWRLSFLPVNKGRRFASPQPYGKRVSRTLCKCLGETR